MEHLVRSLGYGVYHVGATDLSSARSVAEQIGTVLEAWSDPGDPGSHVVLLSSGFDTSKLEAAVAGDPEVAASVRRATSASPQGSLLRGALRSVSRACQKILGGRAGAPDLEP